MSGEDLPIFERSESRRCVSRDEYEHEEEQ